MRRFRPWITAAVACMLSIGAGCALDHKDGGTRPFSVINAPAAIEVVPVWVSSAVTNAGVDVNLDVWLNDIAQVDENATVIATVIYGDSDVLGNVTPRVCIQRGDQHGSLTVETKEFDVSKCKYRIIRIEVFDDNNKGSCSGTVLVMPKSVRVP